MRARTDGSPRRWPRRLVWLGAFWITGVATMGIVTLLLRWLMGLARLA